MSIHQFHTLCGCQPSKITIDLPLETIDDLLHPTDPAKDIQDFATGTPSST